jgi:DNA-binding NarL/FixJ family response regulator
MLEANSGQELLERLKFGPQPDVAIIDINMPEMDGLETLVSLKKQSSEIGCIMLTHLHEEDAIINMMYKGANGYLHKSCDPVLIPKAVHAVYENGFFQNPSLRNITNYESIAANSTGFQGKEPLNAKEVEFIRLSARNLTYNKIATIMKLSPKTVQNYRDNLFAKLQINTRSALTLYGVKNGIIHV